MINQIVWQRALKVYLSGSEAISSMIVVLVFMFGLGMGAFHVGRSARRFKNPLRTVGYVEILLFFINLAICFILGAGIAESANSMQRAAAASGIPLRAFYAFVSAALLFPPCYLMGLTMPLASEASQRQLKIQSSRFVTTLFFLNTIGAVGGALLGGFYLLPYFGQRKALIVAAGLNGAAGILLFLHKASRETKAAIEPSTVAPAPPPAYSFRSVDYFAFFLGFCALAYEMYLFRMAALFFTPTPTTFTSVLFLYLLAWSLGLWLVRRIPISFSSTLLITFIVTSLLPLYNYLATEPFGYMPVLIGLVPCLLFGLAFGKMLEDTTRNWGNDVGNLYFMNTIGSSLGILATVLLGYRVNPIVLGWAISIAYLLLALAAGFRLPPMGSTKRRPVFYGSLFYGMGFFISSAWLVGSVIDSSTPGSSTRSWFGPDGVVQLRGTKAMYWDGLWHSNLSQGDHVGTNNWLLGVVPVLAAPAERELDVLVVGLGTGITVKTIAGYPSVRSVHVYEINKSLKKLIEEFPAGTLEVAQEPKVEIEWTDGRIGLVLSDRQYDLITQQPTYLKQAGSSMLLSREYMQMVRKRLKPGGIFCVYSNSLGNAAQAAVVRKAASEVFPYCESLGAGYMLLLSDSPIAYSEEKIRKLLESLPMDSTPRREATLYGLAALAGQLDNPKLDWTSCRYPVTDDHPIVEYPAVAQSLCPTIQPPRRAR